MTIPIPGCTADMKVCFVSMPEITPPRGVGKDCLISFGAGCAGLKRKVHAATPYTVGAQHAPCCVVWSFK